MVACLLGGLEHLHFFFHIQKTGQYQLILQGFQCIPKNLSNTDCTEIKDTNHPLVYIPFCPELLFESYQAQLKNHKDTMIMLNTK